MIIQQRATNYATPAVVVPIVVGSSSSASSGTSGDTVTQTLNFSSSYNNYSIGFLPVDCNIENITPAIFTFENNTATRLTSGIGRIVFDYGTHKQAFTLDFRGQTDTSSLELIGFSDGTAGKVSFDFLTELLTEGGDLNYYNGLTYAECASKPGGIQRNPNCWASSLDFSGVPIQHLYSAFFGGGALVTPRHFLCTNHYEPGNKVGMNLSFLGSDGVVYTRSVIAQTTGSNIPGNIINPVLAIGDVCMFLLNSELPSAVKKYPLIGDWLFKSTFKRAVTGYAFYDVEFPTLFVCVDQKRRARVGVCGGIIEDEPVVYPLQIAVIEGVSVTRTPTTGIKFAGGIPFNDFQDFQYFGITGDSGSPLFTLDDSGGLIFACCTTTGLSGAWVTSALANALILDVDAQAGGSPTNYTVTVAPDPTL